MARTVWLKLHGFDLLSICCGFVVQQAIQIVVQQTKPMEFEPIEPRTTANTRRGAVYTAQWSIGREDYRHAGAIGVS